MKMYGIEYVFIILFVNREAIVLPKKYPKSQCDKIGKEWEMRYKCISAPIENCHYIAIPVEGMVKGNEWVKTKKVCE